jgi:hypothetical protein
VRTAITILIVALAGPAFGQGKGITWNGPRLTPQEAADILRPHQYVAPPTCDRCDGPYIVIAGGGPSLGPWDEAAGMGPYFNRVHWRASWEPRAFGSFRIPSPIGRYPAGIRMRVPSGFIPYAPRQPLVNRYPREPWYITRTAPRTTRPRW